MSKVFLTWLGLLILGSSMLNADCNEFKPSTPPPFLENKNNSWADSVLQSMTLRQKIGQLFMVAAWSDHRENKEELDSLIKNHHIGGLIFFQGGPVRQAQLTNHYQSISETPLFVAMDAEWGLGMRLDSVITYPRQMTLGALEDNGLIYQFGADMADQLKRLGVHISFSPVIDVNNNPENPVINNRSFGENKYEVAEKGLAYMRGLQDNFILANGKHFPGHGDTDTDSHKDLPVIDHDILRLDSLEMYPFKKLMDEGLASIMVAHLNIPALDSTEELASTLSKKIVTDLLRKQMQYEGLVFTDALNMKGVSKYFEPGELDLKALMAGNDVLLFPEDVPVAIDKIEEAVKDGKLTEKEIDEHCMRILKAKKWCGLDSIAPIKTENLYQDLNHSEFLANRRKMIEQSITVLTNKNDLIPITDHFKKDMAVVNIGTDQSEDFSEMFSRNFQFDEYFVERTPDFATIKSMTSDLGKYDLVVFNFLNTSNRTSINFGITEQAMRIVQSVNGKTKVITNLFANPYALRDFKGLQKIDALVIAYQDDSTTQHSVANLIAGAIGAKGKLPVSISDRFEAGYGLETQGNLRLMHSEPEIVGIPYDSLLAIDTIAMEGITEQAYPGCRVLIAKSGRIIWDKSYGHQTYEEKLPVNENTVYDLASVTKIFASTASVMKLQDEEELSVDYNLCDYLDISDTTACYNINLKEMMSHFARLKPWIPFYLETLDKGRLDPKLYRNAPEEGFSTQVTENLYINNTYADSIFNNIANSALRPTQEYRYSDLGFYFIKRIIEDISEQPLEEFVAEKFYSPLKLETMGYLPLERLDLERIAPTEYDMLFRKELVHGYVHDPGAAMIGGVAGHAGLFSNAQDAAVMMQMFMNKGSYGGVNYIKPETVEYFTTCHYCDQDNRRGVGFDKPSIEGPGPSAKSASKSSFGHSGFTGVVVWADPEYELVYIFLSNRVYPNAENRKLIDMDIRTRIHQVVYDALDAPVRKELAKK
ncbi:glycoside hydrolase family 3 N-terminal domain-containing protein [Halocola ammonii]